jgi:hypothetical protein
MANTTENVNGPQVGPGSLVGKFVEVLCDQSERITTDPEANPFYLNHPPPISLTDFAERLQKYFACSPESFVVASLYLRRLYAVRPDLFCPRSAHKLFLTTLTVAVKFTDDVTCKQSHYSRCGGIEVEELNALETKVLRELAFNLFVSVEQYNQSLNILNHVVTNLLSSMVDQQAQLSADKPTTQLQVPAKKDPQFVRGSYG